LLRIKTAKMLEFAHRDFHASVAVISGISASIGDPSHFDFGIGRYLEILVVPAPDIPVVGEPVVA